MNKDHIVLHSEEGLPDVIAFGPMTREDAINFANRQPMFRRELLLDIPEPVDWHYR